MSQSNQRWPIPVCVNRLLNLGMGLIFAGCTGLQAPQDFSSSLVYALPAPATPICNYADYVNIDANDVEEEVYSLFVQAHEYLYTSASPDLADDLLHNAPDLIDQLPMLLQPVWRLRYHIDQAYLQLKQRRLPLGIAYAGLAVEEGPALDTAMWIDALIASAYLNHQMLDSARTVQIFDLLGDLVEAGIVSEHQSMEFYKIQINYYNNFGGREYADSLIAKFVMESGGSAPDLAEAYRLRGINRYMDTMVNHVETERLFRQSLIYYRTAPCPDLIAMAKTFSILGAVYKKMGEFQKAVIYTDSALYVLFGDDRSYRQLKSNIISITLLSDKADRLADWALTNGDTVMAQDAYHIYQRADSLFTAFIAYDRDTYIHNNFYDNYFYSSIIKLCGFMYGKTRDRSWLLKMLGYVGRYKSESLRRDQRMQFVFNQPAYNKLPPIKQIAVVDQELERLNKAEVIEGKTNYRRKIELMRTLGEQYEYLRTEYPAVYRMLIPASSTEGIDNLLMRSREDRVARLYYYIGAIWYNPYSIYCISVYQGEIALFELDHPPELDSSITRLYDWHQGWQSPDDVPVTVYAKTSHTLYNLLFKDVYDHVSEAGEIRIMADHILTTIAFEALVTNEETYEDFGSLPYLIKEVNITYGWTVDELQHEHIESNSNRYFLGMAWSDKQTIETLDPVLRELPESAKEIDSLKTMRFAHGKYYKGYECSKGNFIQSASAADILHLAVHGRADRHSRMGSVLFFRDGNGIDTLYPHELMYKHINPQIVLLSACESGAGLTQEEEGIYSMGRAFYVAGAEYIVSSLWTLPERASRKILVDMYRRNLQARHYPLALSEAKKSYLSVCRRDESFPGYWAGIIIQQ